MRSRAAAAALITLARTHAFAPTSTLVLRAARGALPATALAPAFLDELSPSGALLSTLDLAICCGAPLRLPAGAGGALELTADGAAALASVWVGAAGAPAAGAPRALLRVAGSGTLSVAPLPDGAAGAPCATSGGVATWLAGAGANATSGGGGTLVAWPAGGGAQVTLAGGGARAAACALFGGQLFVAAGAGVAAVGYGLPTSGAPALRALPGVVISNATAFAFDSPQSLWVCDGAAGGAGLARFTRVPGGARWARAPATAVVAPCVDVFVRGTGASLLVGVALGGGGAALYNPANNTAVSLTSADARGVAAAPAAAPSAAAGHLLVARATAAGGFGANASDAAALAALSFDEISGADGSVVATIADANLTARAADSVWGPHGGAITPTADGAALLAAGYGGARGGVGAALAALLGAPRGARAVFASTSVFSGTPLGGGCGAAAAGPFWLAGVGGAARGGLVSSPDGRSERSVAGNVSAAAALGACAVQPGGALLAAPWAAAGGNATALLNFSAAPLSALAARAVAPLPGAPLASTASGFALSPDRLSLFIAHACVAGAPRGGFPACPRGVAPGVAAYARANAAPATPWRLTGTFISLPTLGVAAVTSAEAAVIVYATAFDVDGESQSGGPALLLAIDVRAARVDVVADAQGDATTQWRGIALAPGGGAPAAVAPRALVLAPPPAILPGVVDGGGSGASPFPQLLPETIAIAFGAVAALVILERYRRGGCGRLLCSCIAAAARACAAGRTASRAALLAASAWRPQSRAAWGSAARAAARGAPPQADGAAGGADKAAELTERAQTDGADNTAELAVRAPGAPDAP